MVYKCPKALGNQGLSDTLCFDEKSIATLFQRTTCKSLKGMVAGGYQINNIGGKL